MVALDAEQNEVGVPTAVKCIYNLRMHSEAAECLEVDLHAALADCVQVVAARQENDILAAARQQAAVATTYRARAHDKNLHCLSSISTFL